MELKNTIKELSKFDYTMTFNKYYDIILKRHVLKQRYYSYIFGCWQYINVVPLVKIEELKKIYDEEVTSSIKRIKVEK